jgi:hypothetical protein
MPNTHLAACNPPAGNSDVDDHIALMVVKLSLALTVYRAKGAVGQVSGRSVGW